MCISESWERENTPLNTIFNLDDYTVVSNAAQRRGVGGRPAIIVNTKNFMVDNLTQSKISIPWGVEIVWVLLTPKNATNSSIVQNIAVASVYCKPNSRKKTVLLDHIAEVYHSLSAKYRSVKWIIAGDTNDLKLTQILSLNSQLKQCVKEPTRLNPPAILDPIITDLHSFYHDAKVVPPLDVDDDKDGVPSDHLMVVMEPISNTSSIKQRNKTKIEFRSLHDNGFLLLEEMLKNKDWRFVHSDISVNILMERFQQELFSMFDISFPVKSKWVTEDDEPYFNDELHNLRRKVRREYHKNRKSIKYLSLLSTYKEKLTKAKRVYYRKKVESLKSSNSRQWYRQFKKLTRYDQHEARTEVASIKHLPDCEQVELIADKFAKVSNEYAPLDRSQIKIPLFSHSDTPEISEKEVLETLNDLNPNKSESKDDVPAKILKRFSKFLSKPLTILVNKAIKEGYWPDFLKLERVTPIPKISNPKEIKDLRNISGLMNLDKVMEKIVCKRIVDDMKSQLDPSQYANQKGLSIQHYLIKMIDRILAALDRNSSEECFAVLATLVDWKEAFPRQCPTLGIQSFIENGVRPSLIPIIMSYFENRKMYVKWHGLESKIRNMPGGGPQGGTMGIWSYLSQSNNNADCVPQEDRFKFVDDLTFLEIINLLSVGLASYNVKNHVPSNILDNNQFVSSDLLKSQTYLETINEWTENQKMILNPDKTKSILFNFTNNKQFTTDLTVKGEDVEMISESRLLGTIITSDLKWNKNTEKLVSDANRRLKLLHSASKFTRKVSDLKVIYMSFIRSKLEHSAVVWHSSLSENNKKDLERVQKAALKIILKGNYIDYEDALEALGLQTLDKRREIMCLKFAKQCLRNEKAKTMFPLAKNNHSMKTRLNPRFKESHARTNRYQKSAIPFMQRLLNNDHAKVANILNN